MGDLLSRGQLEALAKAYAAVETFPVGGKVERQARELMARLSSPQLCQIIGHHIKFLETLAVTELRVRGELPFEAGVLHALEVATRAPCPVDRVETYQGKGTIDSRV